MIQSPCEILIDLEEYYKACDNLVFDFIDKYFKDEGNSHDWVGEIGGVAIINDYYFNFDDIVFALKKKVSRKKLFEWYDYSTDPKIYETGKMFNFNSFIKGER